MDATLTVRLTPRAHEALRRLARQQHTTEAEAAARVLDGLSVSEPGAARSGDGSAPEEAFDEPIRPGSALDLARHLCGIIKDAPPDLSSNPKYMEGFGE